LNIFAAALLWAVTGFVYLSDHAAASSAPGREIVQALRRMGWVAVSQKGSHVQLTHPERGGRVTVPVHVEETIGPGLLRSILAQARISSDECRTAL
jgi:predicted RNA binding protein YcfA (HicA-like mRNA interferase family)